MTSKERLIQKLGSEDAYKEWMRSIAKKAKTTNHGFNNPEVRNRAIDNSLKSRGYKRKGVENSSKVVDKTT